VQALPPEGGPRDFPIDRGECTPDARQTASVIVQHAVENRVDEPAELHRRADQRDRRRGRNEVPELGDCVAFIVRHVALDVRQRTEPRDLALGVGDWIEFNVVKTFRKRMLKEARPRLVYPTDPEVTRLVAGTIAMVGRIWFLAQTGMRQEEVCSLRWTQVDLDRREIRLDKTKTSTPRIVPLRHKFANEFLQRGGDIASLQAILGHKTISMTMRYSHLQTDRLHEVMHSAHRRRCPLAPQSQSLLTDRNDKQGRFFWRMGCPPNVIIKTAVFCCFMIDRHVSTHNLTHRPKASC
jgi:hypothetical protein